MRVSQSVRAVQVPESNPMHPQFTTIYLVGGEQSLSIDTGADEERYRWMLKGYLAAHEKTEIALSALTHFHFDHSSNLRWVCEEFEARACIAGGTAERLGEKLLPAEEPSLLQDESVIEVASAMKLRALHTPGHSPDSHCFYLEDEGVLFTGDTILGGSTSSVTDLQAYMQSLRRLYELPNLQVICPGHGPLIHQPRERIAEYIRHREERESQVIGALAGGEALSSWEIMLRLYPEIDSRLRRLADGNVRAHLAKLASEGRVKVYEGKQRPRDEEALARAASEAAERAEVLRRAEAYRQQAQQRALFLQENPPTAEWLEPPRYEMA